MVPVELDGAASRLQQLSLGPAAWDTTGGQDWVSCAGDPHTDIALARADTGKRHTDRAGRIGRHSEWDPDGT